VTAVSLRPDAGAGREVNSIMTRRRPRRISVSHRLTVFHRTRRRALLPTITIVLVVLCVLAVSSAALAGPAGPGPWAAPKSLPEVNTGIRNWVIGILASIATLFLVLAGVYWATAGGDPAQVDKAKGALRNALIGYGLAILAPVLLQVVQGIVGG
jgi:uncharacterized BrkB/YihY/UPF0761 family membrane protein